MTTSTVAGPGPGPGPGLPVVEEFLNTLDERSFTRLGERHAGGEVLGTPGALSAWLASHGQVPPGTPASRADLAMAHGIRQALRSALLLRASARGDGSGAGAAAGDGDGADGVRDGGATLARGNDALGGIPLRVEFGPDGSPRLAAATPGAAAGGSAVAAQALAGIVAAVALSQARGTWKRLKMCAADDCHWVFYDTSRGGGGRWCSMSACGNRDKTRAYRRRSRLT